MQRSAMTRMSFDQMADVRNTQADLAYMSLGRAKTVPSVQTMPIKLPPTKNLNIAISCEEAYTDIPRRGIVVERGFASWPEIPFQRGRTSHSLRKVHSEYRTDPREYLASMNKTFRRLYRAGYTRLSSSAKIKT